MLAEDTSFAIVVLLLAAGCDALVGDPKNSPHPVRAIGWAIAACSRIVFALFPGRDRCQRFAGIVLAIGTIFGSGAIAWLAARAVDRLPPFLAACAHALLLASCFAGKSLADAAREILRPLLAGEIAEARCVLSQYVGRDTENLSPAEILRAALETVAENATDGVVAPLSYAIAGAFFPHVGSFPAAIAYKAASTLDSMVGYREAPYTHLGWCSAKVEDALTWLPCRLNVLTLALLSGRPGFVLSLCQRDAPLDPSPNAGWSECAYAAILGVRLGGTNRYRGIEKQKPFLGNAERAITPAIVERALELTRTCFLIWLAVGLTLLALRFFWTRT